VAVSFFCLSSGYLGLTSASLGGDNKSTEVYAFGRNDAGQCGVGSDDDTPPPKAVLSPIVVDPLSVHRIIHVACGGAHTAAVTSNGALFTWGWGLYGQLGHGPDIKELTRPKDVAELHGIFVAQVSCGGFHTAAVTSSSLSHLLLLLFGSHLSFSQT
jgi:alpha-tubulin suppressor-like RCC1 family protein